MTNPAPVLPPAAPQASHESTRQLVAFHGDTLIASGDVARVAERVAQLRAAGAERPVLVFDASTSELVDVDPRVHAFRSPSATATTPDSDLQSAARSRGRPRLGVVSREVSLLPRHWDWLATQPGGASGTLRRLVDQARAASVDKDRRRRAQEAAYRFMSAVLGDAAHFEEATRALFAGDAERFAHYSEAWPPDLRAHARHLAAIACADAHAAAPSPSPSPSPA